MKRRIISLILAITAAASAVYGAAATEAVTYTPLGVPAIDSYWKTWEDYRCVSDEYSPNYKFIQRWGWADGDGFMRCDGETDLGIPSDYYLVAMGSYYGTGIGTKYRITLDTGRVFYAALADQKDDADTDVSHRYGTDNKDVIEFLVDTPRLDGNVKLYGSANVYMALNGRIASVERITFE